MIAQEWVMLAVGTGLVGTVLGTGQRPVRRWCQIDGWVKDTCHRSDHPCCPVCGTATAQPTTGARPKPMPTALTTHAHAPHHQPQQAVGTTKVTVTVVPGTTEARATVVVTGGTRIQQLAAGIGLAGAAASVIAAHLATAIRALSAGSGTVPVSSGRVIAGEIADRPEEVQR